jgi:hypothetical protein
MSVHVDELNDISRYSTIRGKSHQMFNHLDKDNNSAGSMSSDRQRRILEMIGYVVVDMRFLGRLRVSRTFVKVSPLLAASKQ